jgi:hypothetical protein
MTSKDTYEAKYEGKYVIAVTEKTGVHFGLLKRYKSEMRLAYLEKARSLFNFPGQYNAFDFGGSSTMQQIIKMICEPKMVESLNSMSKHGITTDDGILSQESPEVMITDIVALFVCSEEAIKNLSEYKTFK